MKQHLDFTVTIEADQATLKLIQTRLTGPKKDAVLKAIAEAIECKDDFDCKIADSRILLKSAVEGGLNADEWIRQHNLSDQPKPVYNHDFQD